MNTHDETALDRLLSVQGKRDLSVAQCADVLGLSVSMAHRMVTAEVIGSRRCQGRGEHRETIHIPRSSVVRFLVRSSRGDAADTLLAEIEAKAPHWLDIAKREHLQKQNAGLQLGVRSLQCITLRQPDAPKMVQTELFS